MVLFVIKAKSFVLVIELASRPRRLSQPLPGANRPYKIT